MVDKALDGDSAPQWVELTEAAGLRALLRPLDSAQMQAALAGVEKAPPLGFALVRQRLTVGEGLPEQAANAARLAWVKAMSPERQLVLASAQTYHWRRAMALVSVGVERLVIDGEDFGSPVEVAEMLAEADPETGADVVLELAQLVTEFVTLGKAGPMCSERLCGPPTGSLAAGTATDAPQPGESNAATAAAPSEMASAAQCEGSTASSNATSAGG